MASKPPTQKGGARPNSGPQPAKLDVAATQDPLEFLLSVQNNPLAGIKDRISAAKAAAAIVHGARNVKGKKQERQEAGEAVSGRYEPQLPPKLQAVK